MAAFSVRVPVERVRFDTAATLVFDGSSGCFGTLDANAVTATPNTVIRVKLTRLPTPLRPEYSLGNVRGDLAPLLAPDLPDGFRLRVDRTGTLLLSCPVQKP